MKLLQTKIVKLLWVLGGKAQKTTIFRCIHKSKNSLVEYTIRIQRDKTILFLKIVGILQGIYEVFSKNRPTFVCILIQGVLLRFHNFRNFLRVLLQDPLYEFLTRGSDYFSRLLRR